MSSRGDLHKQLSRVVDTIKAQGYKFEEVMPEEMQDHFHDMTALKDAREYIKMIEAREVDLRAENDELLSKLQAKQAEIDDQPAELKALQVDLRQAYHETDYYKRLANDAQVQAERFQIKLIEASKQQTTVDVDSRRIERLERNLADREAVAHKLREENCRTADLYETQHKYDQALIEEKDKTITAMIEHSRKLEAEKTEEMEDHEKVSGAHDSLIECLERDSMNAAQAFNRNSAKLLNQVQLSNQLHSAIASELVPLQSFYKHALEILDAYQTMFATLSNTDCRGVPSIPKSVDDAMDFANDSLYSWQHVTADLHAQESVQGEVLRQVDDMVGVAANVYLALEGLKDSVSDFLHRLRADTHALSATNTKVASNQATIVLTPKMAPSQGSVASLKSFVKTFVSARS
jgi:myosin heavy subunit